MTIPQVGAGREGEVMQCDFELPGHPAVYVLVDKGDEGSLGWSVCKKHLAGFVQFRIVNGATGVYVSQVPK
jgi:hypothetical protein